MSNFGSLGSQSFFNIYEQAEDYANYKAQISGECQAVIERYLLPSLRYTVITHSHAKVYVDNYDDAEIQYVTGPHEEES